MNKYCFCGADASLLRGIEKVKCHTQIENDKNGTPVDVKQAGKGISIKKNGERITLTYGATNEFYRALSQLNYVANTGNEVCEEAFTKDLCIMADVSRNAVYTMPSIKRMIRYMALAGYNSLMLYTEDTFEVEEYPHFGHMRGRYSKAELKEIDAYAYDLGIEVIPCIQTLAHLTCALRWPGLKDFADTGDIMLVDDERTYAFIDAMLRTCLECFRSRRINIGMDEAHQLGLGKYLRLNGYKNQHEIMLHHLDLVTKQCHKAGYHPMIWSDMFFRMTNPDMVYSRPDVEISQDIIDLVPEGLTLVHWDYRPRPFFEHMVNCHLKFKNNTLAFAGGAWKWSGFVPNNKYSITATDNQMSICREKGIDSVIVTCWGDNGAEASHFSVLASILFFAEKAYLDKPSNELLERRSNECFGIGYGDLLLLDEPNQMPGIDLYNDMVNPSKYLLYNDPMGGLMDAHLDEKTVPAFVAAAEKLEPLASHPIHGYIYDTLAKLCRVLELKGDMSVKLREAYKAGDKAALAEMADKTIPECIARLDTFIAAMRYQWYYESKTFVFSNHELRLGGLRLRLESTAMRLKAYLAGETDKIEELEQPVLEFTPVRKESHVYPYICHNLWLPNATVGQM